MKIKTFIIVRDYCKGKLIKEEMRETHSLVQAFPAFLSALFRNASVLLVPDTGGTNRTLNGSTQMIATAALGVTTNGIVVGTGNAAVLVTDHALQTLIAHGVGAGQLSYSAVDFPNTWSVVGNQSYMDIRRFVTNNSPGNITIEEIGLYVIDTSTNKFCIERTLFNTTILVGNNKEIVYRFIITV
jgi:hypothetical protein